MKKICTICGKEFETLSGRANYCGSDCKRIGQRQRRKEWEARTGYRDKQRKAAADLRAEQAKAVELEAKKSERKRRAAENRIKRKKERQESKELQERAERGDKIALMWLALRQRNIMEYWRIRKEIVLDEDERLGTTGKNTVGGIDVYDDAFEYKIMEMLQG